MGTNSLGDVLCLRKRDENRDRLVCEKPVVNPNQLLIKHNLRFLVPGQLSTKWLIQAIGPIGPCPQILQSVVSSFPMTFLDKRTKQRRKMESFMTKKKGMKS